MGLAQEGSHVKQLGSLVPTGTWAPQVGKPRLQHTAIYIQKQQIPAMYFTPSSWQNVPISSSFFFFPSISPVQSILNLSNWGVLIQYAGIHPSNYIKTDRHSLNPLSTHYISVKVNMLCCAKSVLFFRIKCYISKKEHSGIRWQRRLTCLWVH